MESFDTENILVKIAILHHSRTDPKKAIYLLYHCCQYWVQQGHSIVHINGTDSPLPAADLLILHVNLSVVPQAYIEIARNYPVVINKSVIDITRHVFSENIIDQNDIYDGPVIVKTRNNYGGMPERKINGMNGKYIFDTIKVFLWQRSGWLRSRSSVEWLANYPVYESSREVPLKIWQNKNLVVEKFLPEHGSNGDYQVREWLFLGDREIHYINICRDPVIRGHNTYRREYLAPEDVPVELRTTRTKLGFDYGKFDYAMYNGKPVLYDINKTIGIAPNTKDRPGAFDYIKAFSQGIEFYQQVTAGQ